VCLKSGYKTITPTELSNALFALKSKLITFRAFRIYLGCFSLIAIREAATRLKRKNPKAPAFVPRYRVSELRRLTEASEKEIRRELNRLKRIGLVSFSETEIKINKRQLQDSEVLLANLSGARSPNRPIPVPRSALRLLASSTKPALTKTMLAYILRGLTIDRKTGEVRGKGTLKLSWVTEALGLSERAANYSRAELIKIGWISKDSGSFQRKLNRDGAYFSINLAWVNPKSAAYQSNLPAKPNDSSAMPESEFAPPEAKTCTEFAPPYKDKKTPYGSKDQKTLSTAQNPTGVFKNEGQGKPPNIRDVQPEDLKSFGRVEKLFFQAVRTGLLDGTEVSAINFIGAAARALNVPGDAPRVFMGIVRKRLWHHISQADEDRALRALRRYREDDPDRFRVPNGVRLAA